MNESLTRTSPGGAWSAESRRNQRFVNNLSPSASSHLRIIPRSKAINPKFYERALRSLLFDHGSRSISLIMRPSLQFEDLDKLRVLIPPPEEQTAIAAYPDAERAKLDAPVGKVDAAKELLQKCRTSAVAGKIDARGHSKFTQPKA